MFKLRKAVVVALGAAIAIAGPGAMASADAKATNQRLVLKSGTTSLALAPATAKALSDNGISVTPTSEARVTKRGISFPIVGGFVNPATLAGTVSHTGGLTFSAGGKSLTIRSFVISTVTGKLSAYVDEVKGRLRILDLNVAKVKVFASKTIVRVLNVKATLNAAAAKALNGYFGTKLFKAGLAIGTARVDAHYRAVYTR